MPGDFLHCVGLNRIKQRAGTRRCRPKAYYQSVQGRSPVSAIPLKVVAHRLK